MSLSALILTTVLAAQTPTRAEDAQAVAELIAIGPECDAAGYRPRPDVIDGARQQFVQRWESAGSNPDDAVGLLDDATKTQTARMEAIAPERSNNNPSEQNRREGMLFRDFVLSSCLRSSQRFPEAFEPSEEAGRSFYGWMGVWLDYPLAEEAAFYLTARGHCSGFTEPFDARAVADRIVAVLPRQPDAVTADVRQELVRSYGDGLAARPRLDRTQCGRLMPRAAAAFRAAWDHHDGAKGQPLPF